MAAREDHFSDLTLLDSHRVEELSTCGEDYSGKYLALIEVIDDDRLACGDMGLDAEFVLMTECVDDTGEHRIEVESLTRREAKALRAAYGRN